VDPRELKFMSGFNARTPRPGLEAHIRALADSMKSEGYYMDKPIAVYIAREGDQEVKYVSDGHCRTKAVLLAIQEGAEIETIPAVPEERGVSLEDLTVKLYRSNTGLPLTPYETGLVCKRLIRYGLELKLSSGISTCFAITVPYPAYPLSGLLLSNRDYQSSICSSRAPGSFRGNHATVCFPDSPGTPSRCSPRSAWPVQHSPAPTLPAESSRPFQSAFGATPRWFPRQSCHSLHGALVHLYYTANRKDQQTKVNCDLFPTLIR
jgi:hypothetical protein